MSNISIAHCMHVRHQRVWFWSHFSLGTDFEDFGLKKGSVQQPAGKVLKRNNFYPCYYSLEKFDLINKFGKSEIGDNPKTLCHIFSGRFCLSFRALFPD